MIIVKDLIKHFDKGLTSALRGISLTIQEGEVLSIMGPSGCGKTTLLNIIGTLDTPTAGGVLLDGQNIFSSHAVEKLRAGTFGFIFQFHHLIPNLTLLENVEIPMYALKKPKKYRRERAAMLLKKMGLKERLHFLPGSVSGGERQRAAAARAMANSPRVILADEPTGNLDTENGWKLMDLLLNSCSNGKQALLIATHNPEIAARTRKTIWMKNGLIESEKHR